VTKTIHEIKEEHILRTSEIMNSYLDVKDEIRQTRQLTEGAYLDRLSGAERMSVLSEQLLEKAQHAYESTLTALTKEWERYHSEVASRRVPLKEQLFKVGDAGAGSRAALATDTELGVLLEYAIAASNKEMGRAVFTAAEQRGLGDLMASYFDNLDTEARDLYQEYSELPDESALQKERANIERVVQMPTPEELMPWATAMGVR
jgi:hypothetical protein